MTDQERELQLTPSEMIRRAARASRRKSMEERWEAIQRSEAEAERVKARFARSEIAEPEAAKPVS